MASCRLSWRRGFRFLSHGEPACRSLGPPTRRLMREGVAKLDAKWDARKRVLRVILVLMSIRM